MPAATLHRIGAVARMLRMPVATLRVWQRRYGLANTALSPSGQRLYSADDVRRLALLKQLTEQGHAIGRLAALDMAQLQRVSTAHAQALATTHTLRRAGGVQASAPRADRASRPWRLVVVGQALGGRLQRPKLLRQLGRPVEMLGPFADVAQAAAALSALPDGRPADAWLLHEPQLHAGWLAAIEAAVPALTRAPMQAPVAVLYGYAADAVCESLAASGVCLLREPQPDAALSQWLRHWAEAAAASGAPKAFAPGRENLDGSDTIGAIVPRRWDDAALTDFVSRSTTVACECPHHLAELLMQLSHFEAYSAQCGHRSTADAELHAYLGRVAAEARAGFEAALEQVALHEGLILPPSAA